MTQTSNATEAAILRATRRLLQEHSFDDLSVARILEAADVSRATFYFYFASKDDAFVALLSEVADGVVSQFERILAEADPAGDPAGLSAAISGWLQLEDAPRAVIRNAIHEWPRRQEIRRLYLTGVGQMADVLAAAIDADRDRGVAPAGVPAPELASVLLWTIERTLAGSLAGEAHLEDTEGVTRVLGDLFVQTIYGDHAAG